MSLPIPNVDYSNDNSAIIRQDNPFPLLLTHRPKQYPMNKLNSLVKKIKDKIKWTLLENTPGLTGVYNQGNAQLLAVCLNWFRKVIN